MALAQEAAASAPAAVREAAEPAQERTFVSSAKPAAATELPTPDPATNKSIKEVVRYHAAVLLLATLICATRLMHKASIMDVAVSTHVWLGSAVAYSIALQGCATAQSCLQAVQHSCQRLYSQARMLWHTWSIFIACFGLRLMTMMSLGLYVAASMTGTCLPAWQLTASLLVSSKAGPVL